MYKITQTIPARINNLKNYLDSSFQLAKESHSVKWKNDFMGEGLALLFGIVTTIISGIITQGIAIIVATLIANIGTLTAVLNSGFSKLRSSTEVKQDITQDHRNLTVKLNAVNTYSTNQQLTKLNTVHREIIKFGTHYVESAGRITQTPTPPSNEDLQDGQEQEEE